MTDAADDILGKADAFMKRRRPTANPTNALGVPDEALDDDIPLLTDIVPLEALSTPAAPAVDITPADIEARIAEEVARQLDARLAEQTQSLRTELRQQIQAELAENEQRDRADGLAQQQQQTQADLALALDQWLNRELPDIVLNELDGLAQCLVVRISQALKNRLRDSGHLNPDLD